MATDQSKKCVAEWKKVLKNNGWTDKTIRKRSEDYGLPTNRQQRLSAYAVYKMAIERKVQLPPREKLINNGFDSSNIDRSTWKIPTTAMVNAAFTWLQARGRSNLSDVAGDDDEHTSAPTTHTELQRAYNKLLKQQKEQRRARMLQLLHWELLEIISTRMALRITRAIRRPGLSAELLAYRLRRHFFRHYEYNDIYQPEVALAAVAPPRITDAAKSLITNIMETVPDTEYVSDDDDPNNEPSQAALNRCTDRLLTADWLSVAEAQLGTDMLVATDLEELRREPRETPRPQLQPWAKRQLLTAYMREVVSDDDSAWGIDELLRSSPVSSDSDFSDPELSSFIMGPPQ